MIIVYLVSYGNHKFDFKMCYATNIFICAMRISSNKDHIHVYMCINTCFFMCYSTQDCEKILGLTYFFYTLLNIRL